MTETERQKARAKLIRGISIDRMIADLSGKTYGQLVQHHLRKLGAQLPAGIAASVALCTPEERTASEAIIDDYNAKGYDAAFWASDAGEILTSVSCDLNDALFPNTADDAGIFNLFQLITQNFALMAREQQAFSDFLLAATSQPAPPRAGRRQVDLRQLADDLFSEEGETRRGRERLEETKIVRDAWESPAVQQVATETGLTEKHVRDVYRRLLLHGDLLMARRAISDPSLLRWYYEHGGKDNHLGPDEAIQLVIFARDGKLE